MQDDKELRKKHRTGISCKSCGEKLQGVFAYIGPGSSMKKIYGYGYCKVCKKLYKISMEEV